MEHMIRINAHSHVIPLETMGKAGKYGPELIDAPDGALVLRVGDYRSRPQRGHSLVLDERLSDPKARVDYMDAQRIDKMIVMISPLFYLYWAEADIGIEFSRIQNDALAKFCAYSPQRLYFVATLPLQDMNAAEKELDRSVKELGAKGISIGTDSLAGHELDDESLWPLFEKMEKYDLPVFLHPYPLPLQTKQSDKYNLSWIAGYVHQETAGFCNLVFGGVLDRFPKLKVYLSHGGGAVPYQWGRLEYAATRMPDVKSKRPLKEYLGNFYFDLLIHDIAARRYLVEFAGSDHLIVGDNYPGWDALNGFELVDELNLPAQDAGKICGGTAQKLFNLA